jgi:ubiquilin
MNQLLADPRMIDYLIQSQPSLQAMGPGIREVMQSEEFRRTVADPTVLRNMMEMNRMFSQMGMQVPGMPGAPRQPAFPAPGVTNTTAPQQTQRTSTPTPQASQPNPPQANPFESMFLPTSQQGTNPFAALFAAQPAGQPQQSVRSSTPQQPFGASFQQPQSFGAGQTPAQNPFAAAGQQPPPDLGSMISMLQSLQQLQSLLPPGQPGATPSSASTSPPPADTRPLEERYQVPLFQLFSLSSLMFEGAIATIE